MNRSKIEWTDFTWNPVTGCKTGCTYCYARSIAIRFNKGDFEPKYHPRRMSEPGKRKKPARIFVGSMSDLFGPWFGPDIVYPILNVVAENKRHTFQFLTKHYANLLQYYFPDNAMIGCTATTRSMFSTAMQSLHKVKAKMKFVSVEPLQEEIRLDTKSAAPFEWMIIGVETGPQRSKAEKAYGREGSDWIEGLIQDCRKLKVKVFVKDNAGGNMASLCYPREYPDALIKREAWYTDLWKRMIRRK